MGQTHTVLQHSQCLGHMFIMINKFSLKTLVNPRKSLSTNTFSVDYNIEYGNIRHIFCNSQYSIYFISFKLAYLFLIKSHLTQIILQRLIHQILLQTFPPKRHRFNHNTTLHCLRVHNACSSWAVTMIDVVVCESQINPKQLCHNNWKRLWSYPVWVLNTQRNVA